VHSFPGIQAVPYWVSDTWGIYSIVDTPMFTYSIFITLDISSRQCVDIIGLAIFGQSIFQEEAFCTWGIMYSIFANLGGKKGSRGLIHQDEIIPKLFQKTKALYNMINPQRGSI
jgi:hypothetical protein